MAHPYPPRLPTFDYVGRYRYALTFSTHRRHPAFADRTVVDLTLQQICAPDVSEALQPLRNCFMPDHLHLIAGGDDVHSNCKAFIKAAKQYSGYCYRQRYAGTLWERYCYERVIRDDGELAPTIGYIVANPVRPGWWSTRASIRSWAPNDTRSRSC